MGTPIISNNTSTIHTVVAKSEAEMILQLSLVILLFLSSVTGNVCVCFLLLRNERLRTIPNIFLVNLCTVNLLNTMVNLPLLVLDNVVMCKDFNGKTTSWVTVLLYVTFIILNVYSMVIMMLERYVAIAFGMSYKAWTSKYKSCTGIAVVWSLAIVVSLITMLFVSNIDLRDEPVHVYRGEYFKKAVRFSFLINVILSIFGIVTLSLLTLRSIKLQSLQISSGNISSRCKRARRLHNHSKAVKTIIIITIAYALCFLPGIIFTAVTKDIRNHQNHWRNFIIPLCVFFSNAVDPVVFIARSQSLTRALKRCCSLRSSETLSQVHDFVPSTVGNSNSEFMPRYNIPLSTYNVEHSGYSKEPRELSFQRTLRVESV